MPAVHANTETADLAADAPGMNREAADLAVIPVQPGAVSAVWPHVLPMIEAAREAVPEMIAAREYAEDVKAKAEAGLYQIWLIYEGPELVAAAVSSIEQFTRLTACVVQYTAGRDLDTWLAVWVEEIRGWALANGCQQIACQGRLGWRAALARHDVELAGASYVMEIG